MDMFTLLALVVAAITVFSGYVLFNELPGLGPSPRGSRRSRRP